MPVLCRSVGHSGVSRAVVRLRQGQHRIPTPPREPGLEEPQVAELAQLVPHGPLAIGDQVRGARALVF
jgi:hypothetical protein